MRQIHDSAWTPGGNHVFDGTGPVRSSNTISHRPLQSPSASGGSTNSGLGGGITRPISFPSFQHTPASISNIHVGTEERCIRSMTALERVTGSEIGSRHPLDTLPPTDYPLEKQSPECNPRVSVRVRAPSVGRIGSGVWVSTSFQFFALRMLLYSSGGFSLRYNHRARMCP